MPASTVTCIGGPVQSKSREAAAFRERIGRVSGQLPQCGNFGVDEAAHARVCRAHLSRGRLCLLPRSDAAGSPARGGSGRLQRHDLRRDSGGDHRSPRPSCASGGSSILPSQPASRRRASGCLHSLACLRTSGRAPERPTQSSACTRSASGGSRRRPCCRPSKQPRCCSGPFWLQLRSACAKPTAGRPASCLIAQPVDLAG